MTMKDKSSMGLGEYFFYCMVYMGISMVWYKNLLFRCLQGRTYSESKIVLWVMIGFSIVICAFFLYRRMRTGWTVAISLVVPFGLYTVFAYMKTFSNWIPIFLISAVVLSVAYSAYLLTRKIKSHRYKSKIIKFRIQRCCKMFLSISTAVLVIIMTTIAVRGMFGDNIMTSSVSATNKCDPPQTISNNIDKVLLLQEEEWEKLTTQKRLDVLQTIANVEAHYLGLPNELNVGVSNLKENTLASYDDRTHTISFDLDHIENDSVYEVLNSCCHEARHSFQHRLVDLYNIIDEDYKELGIFQSVPQYDQEFNGSINSDNDIYSYYEQHCEIDARNYADDAVDDYYNKINDYIKNS